jgi:hypothetical protein
MLEHQYKEASGYKDVFFLFGLHLDMHSVDADGTKFPCRGSFLSLLRIIWHLQRKRSLE